MGSSSRNLEIVLHSAKNLSDGKSFSTIDPYAMIWIAGGGAKSEIYKTGVAKKAGSSLVWDYPMLFKFDPMMINNYVLFCKIQHDGKLLDQKICEVQVPIAKLLAGDGSRTRASYPVKTRSGEDKGKLIISYKFSEQGVMSGAKTRNGSGRFGSKKKNVRKGSGGLGSKKKNVARIRSGNGGGSSVERVEGTKKEGLFKRIGTNVVTRVATLLVSKLLSGSGNDHEDKGKDKDDDEDEDGLEDENDEDEDEDGLEDENDEDEDEVEVKDEVDDDEDDDNDEDDDEVEDDDDEDDDEDEDDDDDDDEYEDDDDDDYDDDHYDYDYDYDYDY